MGDIPSWHIVGDWFDNCSCAVPCPCTFAQAPDNGFCESVLFWHVREGHYGDVELDNLSFVRVGRWEGDLWARKATGVAGLYIDDHADDRQMEALPAIIGGRAGGFPGWVNECFVGGRQSRGIERAKITYEIAPDLGHWGVEIGSAIWNSARSNDTAAARPPRGSLVIKHDDGRRPVDGDFRNFPTVREIVAQAQFASGRKGESGFAIRCPDHASPTAFCVRVVVAESLRSQ
jgi:hypothetical protein